MKNIEFKVACPAGHGALKSILGKTPAAQRRGLLHQIDTYFHAPDGNRLKLREVLRSDSRYAELIAYRRSDGAMSRDSDYLITPVPDPDTLKATLSLALGVHSIVTKERELWLIEHTRIHLDTVEDLGAFAEIETVVWDDLESLARAEHLSVRSLLLLDVYPPVTTSYGDLLSVLPDASGILKRNLIESEMRPDGNGGD